MSRRKRSNTVPLPGPKPLLVIAGLPESVVSFAESYVERKHENWGVVAAPFSNDDARLYSARRTIDALLFKTCRFALKRRGRDQEDEIPTPSRLVLAYVAAEGSDALLEAFGFAAYPVPMTAQNTGDLSVHWRFKHRQIETALDEAIRAAGEGEGRDFHRDMLERRVEAMFLPGRNFFVGKEVRLVDRFKAALLGQEPWSSIAAGLKRKTFTYDTLPRYFEKFHGAARRMFVDARDLAFPPPGAHHGDSWVLPSANACTQADLRRLLEGMYRFGSPLTRGLHFDVQRYKSLNGEPFECTEQQRQVLISGTHANVYLNDRVRPPNNKGK